MRKISFICIIAVVMQGILIVLLAGFLLSRQYMSNWANYPHTSQALTIYLKDLPEDKQTAVEQFLLQNAVEHDLYLVRKDIWLDASGYFNGYKIGVYGNSSLIAASLSFLNESILNSDNLSLLLNSENGNSTLGLETGSINRIGSIPHFHFGGRIVVEKMPQLIYESETINGTYSLLGFDDENQEEQFLANLSQVSDLSINALTTELSGYTLNDTVKQDIIAAFLAVQIFLNMILFLVLAVSNLSKYGKQVLLGWSRLSFTLKIFGPFVTASVIGIPVFVIAGWLISGWNEATPILFSYFALAAVINLVFVLIELAIASVVIMLTKPLDAIRNRIPTKRLYTLGILAYLLVSIGIVLAGRYVDGPIQYLSDNAKIASEWSLVSDCQMLSSVSIGQDAMSFSGQSNKLDQDIYDWYSSIAGNEGVYLIQTSFYSADIISTWSKNGIYESVPQEPFWRFTVSPNYLSTYDIELSQKDLTDAENGTRLYLLPSTLSGEERKRIIEWVNEADSDGGEIQTNFSQQKTFKFITYTPKNSLFAWSTDFSSASEAPTPIICVCTPENMAFKQSASLRATGFNGYIKFADATTMEKYTQPKIVSRYNLSDNHLIFSSVGQYIDGVQKDLVTTIAWFGLVFVFLLIMLLGLLITLASIFRIANQERINVQKFLGFSFWQLYRRPMIMLISIVVLELVASTVLQSKYGTLLILFAAIIQLIIFVTYMTRSELKRILLAFKGGS